MELKKIGNVDFVSGGVCAAKGFKANGIQCGLVHAGATLTSKKNDLALIVRSVDDVIGAVARHLRRPIEVDVDCVGQRSLQLLEMLDGHDLPGKHDVAHVLRLPVG